MHMQVQSPQEDLVYADVTVASKHNKKAMIPTKPTVSTTQPDLAVEYSAINFRLCNKKSVSMEERPSHGMVSTHFTIYSYTIVKIMNSLL